jgi:predicted negative regulator of RcsB-dependent stress response
VAKRKPIRKVDKQLVKELRQPDEFVTWVDRFSKYADDHRPLVIGGFIGLFLLVAAGNGVVALVKHQGEKRAAAEFTALQEIGTALDRDGDAAAMDKVDDLIAKASGKSHRTRLYLIKGDLLMEQGEYAKAAEAYEGALAHARKGLSRDLAAIGLASARMKAGDLPQAEASLKGVDGPLSAVADVERVRLAMAQENDGEAQSLVDKLEADYPSSPAVEVARGLLKSDEASPPEQATEEAPPSDE